jgi:hypothetical protein
VALNFPNFSRSYDENGHRVRFWGYDSAKEVSFFVEVGALLRLYPGTQNVEAAILAAFDAGRDRIVGAAERAYSPRDRKSFYILAAADFA